MVKTINILHLSDLHCIDESREDTQRRIKVLFADIERQMINTNIDVLAFTGDITFSGKEEQYGLAQDIFFEKFIRRFRIPKSKILVVPGNHDVDRSSISPILETGLLNSIIDSKSASSYLNNQNDALKRLDNYYDFIQRYFKIKKNTYYSKVLTLKGIKIGFACLNSAWRCSGDSDEGNLFLSDWQINNSVEELSGCALRIALLHHPSSYYHKSEHEYTLNDLKRLFDIVVTGHLHEPKSLEEICPNYDCIIFSAPPIFSSYEKIGYNIYEIDFEQRKLIAKYRKYIRTRDSFAPDVEHADDGKMEFDLPTRDITIYSTALLCQRITAANNALEQSIIKQLALYQEDNRPIFVSPYIKTVSLRKSEMFSNVFSGNLIDLTKNNGIIHGIQQSGKTILLETVTTKYNNLAIEKGLKTYAIYIDLNDKPVTEQEFKALIDKTIQENSLPEDIESLVICVDNLEEKDTSQYYVIDAVIKEKQDWKVIVASSNNVLFEAIVTKDEFTDYQYYKLALWGPSRVREFAKLFCIEKGMNPDAAYSFILNNLRNSDLPASPVIVTLFLYAFLILGGKLSSLSFLEVLKKIEEYKFEKHKTSPQHSLYYKQRILMHLAVICRERDTLNLPIQEVKKFISDYFSSKSLTVDVDLFLKDLTDSGFVAIEGDGLEFKQFVFFDYYLAMACKEKIEELGNLICDLHTFVYASDALSLYCGMNREYYEAPNTLFKLMEPYFRDAKDITLKDLDNYIKDLLITMDRDASSDAEVQRAVSEQVDYTEYDEEFETEKGEYEKRRNYIKYLRNPANTVEFLVIKILALKAFYNTYRNLEGLDGTSKLQYLDRVLEHHIDCNMDLIRFITEFNKDADFRTLVGYVTTIGGQRFLSANLGSESLEVIIRDCMQQTPNDFKKLLLVCLYGDLRLPYYAKYLKEYVDGTNSMSASEIIYLKIKELIIFHEGEVIPTGLISAFESAFKKRQDLYGYKMTKGVYRNIFDKELRDAEIRHKIYLMNQ